MTNRRVDLIKKSCTCFLSYLALVSRPLPALVPRSVHSLWRRLETDSYNCVKYPGPAPTFFLQEENMQRKKKLLSKTRGCYRRLRKNTWRWQWRRRAAPAHNAWCSKCKMVQFCLQNNRPVSVTRCPRCNVRTGVWHIAYNSTDEPFFGRYTAQKHIEIVSGIRRCPGKRADVQKCTRQTGGCKAIQAGKMRRCREKYDEYLRAHAHGWHGVQDKTLE